jgi:dUTPase
MKDCFYDVANIEVDLYKLPNHEIYWFKEWLKDRNIDIVDYQVIFCTDKLNLLPILKEPEASCYDISIRELTEIERSKRVPTGVKSFLVPGLKLNLYLRSSTFDKYNIILANSIGKIESSYRGEILANCINISDYYSISLKNTDNKNIRLDYFQLEIEKSYNHITPPYSGEIKVLGIVNQYIYDNWSNIFPTERGAGGFGSTDNKING